MGYVRLADNESFSDKYNTYILGYCPDGGGVWFASNERHFYYEYPKEFNTKAEAIAFFKQNLDFFFDLSLSLGNNGALYLLDTHESYERNKDYDRDLFNDVVQYCLDEGTGIEYEEDMNLLPKRKSVNMVLRN